MQQSDPFYQKLPFTLQDDQLQPQYVVFGTGLQQSAIAAYLAKMTEKKVLVFDHQKIYGSCMKTITLKQLHLFSQGSVNQKLYKFMTSSKAKQMNNKFYQECTQNKALRGYNIDIQPSVLFGNSIACQCLKQADMDKYLDFRLVSHLLKYEKGRFEQVPLSKGKIFQSKHLSLMQKKLLLTSLHTLTKLYQRHFSIQQDQNSTKQFDKGFGQVSEQMFGQFNQNQQNSFSQFLNKIAKKNKKIMDFMAYIVCNYEYNYSGPIPEYAKPAYTLKSFIQKFGKFISSCGVYGDNPYLYVDNGIGDVTQAFSRIASVFGSTYILHPKLSIQGISEEQHRISIKSNIAPERQITSKLVIYGQAYTREYCNNSKVRIEFYPETSLRLLLLCKKSGKEQQCPSLGYFFDVQGFPNPIYLFMLDQNSHTCPKGYIIYQFQSVIEMQHVKEPQTEQFVAKKVQVLIGKLKQIRGQQFQQTIMYTTSYVREKNIFKSQHPQSIHSTSARQVFLQGGSGLDLDYHFENFVQVVGKKQNYFRKKSPYQDEDQKDGQYEQNDILRKLENINITSENNQQKEETKSQVPQIQKKQQFNCDNQKHQNKEEQVQQVQNSQNKETKRQETKRQESVNQGLKEEAQEEQQS